jgi:hypothetical protein
MVPPAALVADNSKSRENFKREIDSAVGPHKRILLSLFYNCLVVGKKTIGIGHRAARCQYSPWSERCWREVIGRHSMEYCLARRDEIVSNYSSMAPPPDGLSTHYCRYRSVPEFAQPGHAGSKLVAHGVVRIIVKALISQNELTSAGTSRFLPRSPPSSAMCS